MRGRETGFVVCFIVLMGILIAASCGAPQDISVAVQQEVDAQEQIISWDALERTGEMELSYATEFAVEDYGDYTLLTIAGKDRFLLVPEGAETPRDLPEDIVILKEPVQNIYLVSSAAMDLFLALQALDIVKLSGTKESGWYLPEAAEAMERGEILYAGKYSAPDYELVVQSGCALAIENTMIYHTPQVKEQLEKLGVPVLVEHSSYEAEPLGRLEWVKLYGVLLGRREEADRLYKAWLEELWPLLEQENTQKTVAFFYITGNGAVNVRKTQDYLAKLIALAGGNYVFTGLDAEEENALSTMNIQMEEFYAVAKDADCLIYNTTVDDELHSLEELLAKSSLLADFRAVQEGQVYCTGRNFFQETTGMGTFVQELHSILTGEERELKFLEHLD